MKQVDMSHADGVAVESTGGMTSVASRLIVALLLIGLVVWIGLGVAQRMQARLHPEPARIPPPIAVEVMSVQTAPFVLTREYQGTVEADTRAVVSARVPGKVLAFALREGQAVSRGAELVLLDDTESRREVERLMALEERIAGELDLAQTTLLRENELFRQDGIAQAALDAARQRVHALQAQAREARAALDLARAKVDYAREQAPFAGLVQEVFVHEGEFVGIGAPLIALTSQERLKAVVAVSQGDASDIHAGQPVSLGVPAVGQTWPSRVELVHPTLDPATRNLTLSAFFPPDASTGHPGGTVRPGMAVRAVLEHTDEEEVILIPARAIHRGQTSARAFVVEGGVAVRRDLELGPSRQGWVQVLSGLAPGERLITTFNPRLATGEAVFVASEPGEAREPKAPQEPEGGR
ncbi:efflux RND transporter periplasmic adaptor subunit [Desulfonatronum lacustre]|uniref:efflux RND transporter periplasmic adaptor subunit n=1 Tax=Desulfonatronum lacustre TaxID=66849 RepID=UPI000688418A|nr:efflux RND transporter periplasmic adaptor subunit [Desulfonatronum lacustre]